MVLAFWGREEIVFPLPSSPSSGSTIFAAHRSCARSQVLRKTNPAVHAFFLISRMQMHGCSWIFEGSRLQYLIMRPGARDEKREALSKCAETAVSILTQLLVQHT